MATASPVVQRNGALDRLRPLDDEVAERRDHVLGRVEDGGVLRPAVSLREVRRVVTQHEQRSAGRDGVRGRAHDPGELRARQLQVEHGHQVEPAWLGVVLEDVGEHPLDLDAAALGQPLRLLQRDVREVDRRHPPAAAGEPHGVPPLAAGEVERASGREAAHLRCEEPVRLGRPDQLLLRVARVPVLAGEPGPDGRHGAPVLGHGADRSRAGRASKGRCPTEVGHVAR